MNTDDLTHDNTDEGEVPDGARSGVSPSDAQVAAADGRPSAFFENNSARPAQQERSRKRHADLINAGIALLQEKDFEEITVSAIAARAGCAVGSFYSRFADKETYFSALQQQFLAELSAHSDSWFAEQAWQDLAPREALELTITWISGHIVERRAIVRAAYKHNQNQPGVWTPMKAIGQQWFGSASEYLLPRLLEIAPEANEARLANAMQFYYGAMINAVINDPGPMKLHDPMLAKELSRAFLGYLQATE